MVSIMMLMIIKTNKTKRPTKKKGKDELKEKLVYLNENIRLSERNNE